MAETKQTAAAERQQTDVGINNKWIDGMLKTLGDKQEQTGLTLPPNYNVSVALNSAYLILQETVDRDKNPVLKTCSQQSIASALMDMAVQGLNPMKKQCYFVACGGKLTLFRSYQGTMAIAKRVGAKTIDAEIIYDGDEFEYHIENGVKVLDKHKQDFMAIDNTKIKGAYCVIVMEDGRTHLEIMNIGQIKKAWSKGYGYKEGSGVHSDFADQMAKKTVINRACKNIINSSDDAYLNELENTKDEDEFDIVDDIVQEDIKVNANSEDFDDIETIEDAKVISKKETKTQAVQQTLAVDEEY